MLICYQSSFLGRLIWSHMRPTNSCQWESSSSLSHVTPSSGRSVYHRSACFILSGGKAPLGPPLMGRNQPRCSTTASSSLLSLSSTKRLFQINILTAQHWLHRHQGAQSTNPRAHRARRHSGGAPSRRRSARCAFGRQTWPPSRHRSHHGAGWTAHPHRRRRTGLYAGLCHEPRAFRGSRRGAEDCPVCWAGDDDHWQSTHIGRPLVKESPHGHPPHHR